MKGYERIAFFFFFCDCVLVETPGARSNSIMSVLTEKAMVKKEELWEVVGTDQWKISNSLDEEYEPRPAPVIVADACLLVGQERPYCVFTGNCEHFVNELRYGKAESRQVGGNTRTFLIQTSFLKPLAIEKEW